MLALTLTRSIFPHRIPVVTDGMPTRELAHTQTLSEPSEKTVEESHSVEQGDVRTLWRILTHSHTLK